MADGSIKFDIELEDTVASDNVKQLRKEVNELEHELSKTDSKKMTNLADSMEENNNAINQGVEKLKTYQEQIERLNYDLEGLKSEGDFIFEGEQFTEGQKLQQQIDLIREKQSQVKTELKEQNEIQNVQILSADKYFQKTEDIRKSIERVDTKNIADNTAKAVVETKKLDSSVKSVANSTDRIPKSLNKGVKSITRTALALFSIRSIYGAISRLGRQAINSTEEWAVSARGVFSTFSQGLSNALAPVIKSISSMLLTLMGYINAITQAFFGITLFSGKTNKNIGSSVGGAKKLNKELKKINASFDTAEVISSQLDDNMSGGCGGGGVPTVPPIEIPTPDLSVFKTMIDNLLTDLQPFIDTIKSIDFEPLKKSLTNLGKVGSNSFKILGDSAKRVMNNTIGPFIKLLVEDIVPKGLNTVTRIIDRLNPIVDNLLKNVIEPLFNWLMLDFVPKGLDLVFSILDAIGAVIAIVIAGFEKFWNSAIGKAIAFVAGELILAIMQDLTAIFDEIVESIDFFLQKLKEGDPLAEALAFSIGLIVSGLVAWKVATIAFKVAQLALNGVIAIFNALMAMNPIMLVVIAIMALIAVIILLWANWEAITDFFKETIDKLVQWFVDLGTKIGEAFSKAWNKVVEVWQGVKDWFNNTVIQPIANFFSGMWNGLEEGARKAWAGIQNIFSTVAQFFSDIFGKAWTGVKNIFSTGGQIFSGIVDGIVSAFKNIVNAIIDGINRVVSIPFNAINTALNGLKKISILGAKPFGWLPSIGVPKIPRLAKGGVLRQPTLNLAGEYAGARTNPEIVTPQKLLDERIAKGLANLENIQGNNQPIIIKTIIEMEGKQIAEVVNEYNDQKSFNMNGGLVWNT